jgi:rubrerythrin
MAKSLQGAKTHQNLKEAFAGESQANRRYLYVANVADVEGYPEIAGNFNEPPTARLATRAATSTT